MVVVSLPKHYDLFAFLSHNKTLGVGTASSLYYRHKTFLLDRKCTCKQKKEKDRRLFRFHRLSLPVVPEVASVNRFMNMEERNVNGRPTPGKTCAVYAVVNNIPSFYRSADLRRFFSLFVETGGFECFHFRHRPELQSVKKSLSTDTNYSAHDDRPSTNIGQSSQTRDSLTLDSESKTFCCIIKVPEGKIDNLIGMYHQRNWQDSKGDSISSKCLIARLKTSLSPQLGNTDGVCVTEDETDATGTSSTTNMLKYQTRGDKRHEIPDRAEVSEEDILKLPEMRPPTVMPHGNVGTPTLHFMKLIQECKLPPSIIKKLQLDFPKSKNKGKYGSVPYDYQTDVIETPPSDNENAIIKNSSHKQNEAAVSFQEVANKETCSARVSDSKSSVTEGEFSDAQDASGSSSDYKEKRRLRKLAKRERQKLMAERIEEKMIEFEKGGSGSEDDNDTCEEWERHEAMYDDVSSQDRTKERLFEEEMEVVWEKGGSGLVFYTDAQYWQQKEGDFDEQTADDLNVDMSAYYEDGAGDKDIRDFLTIRQEQRRRRGIEKTDRFSAGIGKFECHTKGFGRKIMERQGWTEGSGLGSSVQGIADALNGEGKHPKDKKGLGYRGEKLIRYGGVSAQKKRKIEKDVLISTVYDDPADVDPMEPLLRRNVPNHIKHRDRIN